MTEEVKRAIPERVRPPMPKPEDNTVTDDGAPDMPEEFVRRPFGSSQEKLSAPKRPGYHRHWFNDYPGRVDRAKEAGYAHVNENNDKRRPMKRVVGTSQFGGPLTAYLMEIPYKWFEQDLAREQAKVDEIDAAIKQGKVSTKEGDERYVPKGGIKFTAE